MKVGLNYVGVGRNAVIHNKDGDEDINLKVATLVDTRVMTISQGRDIIALYKDDIIALRDYLNQISHTF